MESITGGRYAEYKLALESSAAATFNLETAVCSHGFFMTAPNQWDPLSKTFQRPLRLSSSSSVSMVQICQPPQASHLILRVLDSVDLSPLQHQSLMEQVRRMLRLSETEEKNVRGFQEMYDEAKTSGFGRIFRSPTLFEDMVKCILVCNCQWSRTLSMARALCELQLELQDPTRVTKLAPKTPTKKESTKRNTKSQEKSRKVKSTFEADETLKIDSCDTCSNTPESNSENTELPFMGNFPSPEELAGLDVNFLGKRCNLGYRASRILGLAQSVVEGRIDLKKLEEDCGDETSLSNYTKMNEQLGEINGFGPFTRANVLMCLGFYHVIPSDSETLRHLNQVLLSFIYSRLQDVLVVDL